MTNEKPSCPECGADAVFEERAARLLQGSCPDCGRAFTILQHASEHAPALGDVPATAGAAPALDEDGVPRAAPDGPACGVCGTTLAVRASSETSLEVTCPSCETRVSYVLDRPEARPRERRFVEVSRGGPREDRGPPREDRGGPRDDREGPRARPCRECGGPLSFTTDAEGNVSGECASCGNRFTLPPRPRFGGGGGRGPPGATEGGGSTGVGHDPEAGARGRGADRRATTAAGRATSGGSATTVRRTTGPAGAVRGPSELAVGRAGS